MALYRDNTEGVSSGENSRINDRSKFDVKDIAINKRKKLDLRF